MGIARELRVERTDIPAMISDHLRSAHGISDPVDATPVIARMRMVKSAEELDNNAGRGGQDRPSRRVRDDYRGRPRLHPVRRG